MTASGDVLFHLTSAGGDGIRVLAGATYAPDAADLDARSWVRAYIEVQAHPFAGTIETVYTPSDVDEWRNAQERLAASGAVAVGGGRAPLVRLVREGDMTEVAVTPSGDDPWPLLRFLV